MALVNSIPSDAADRLTTWLAARLPGVDAIRITDIDIPQSSGMSMTTMLFKAAWRDGSSERTLDLVARVAPSAPGVFMDPDLVREHQVLTALVDSDVPAPFPRWVDTDPAVLGAPFLVMDRVYGQVPADDPPFTAAGWVLDLDPAQRGRLVDNGLQAMLAVHQVDRSTPGLAVLDRQQYGRVGLEQEIGYWRAVLEWAAAGRATPTIDAGFEWICANAPIERDDDLVLCWGDPRIGNILFAEDQTVKAVLDWEMATIGSPEMDLGWWLFIQRHHTEGIGVPLPDGLPDHAATIARFEELSGREVRHAHYYEAFAALRLSILMVRAGVLMIEAGAIPADNTMSTNNPASQILARLIDAPPPEGTSSTFIGNRTA
jgi:aminoglycoside phosphotransferase (APT) family kinase protein